MQKEETMVSVLCLAYNHEKYIRDALESFVNQKTNFEFEIIINDDCSTDNTAKIIKEYEKKYPNIVKPIYQKENQYSKGRELIVEILLPKAKGKYFALCEGDDYWVDENKLQKQVDFLEQNIDYSLCVSNATIVDINNKKIGQIKTIKTDGDLTCEEVINGGGGFISTNSIMAPMKYAKNLPSYFNDFSIDYLWQIYLASCGKSYCFSQDMVAYRANVEGSWTERMKKDLEKCAEINNCLIKKLKEINLELNNKYDATIKNKIIEFEFENLLIDEKFEIIKKKPYKSYMKKLSFSRRIKIYIKIYFPNLYKNIKKIFKKEAE